MEDFSQRLNDHQLQVFSSAVGISLRAIREKREWSIYRLSQESGVDERGIRRIEEGNTAPGVDTVLRLCLALGVRFSQVIENAEAQATLVGLELPERLQ